MAHHNHGTVPEGIAQGTMTAFLHLNPGDTLWLAGWVPGRSSTLWGACVALILLGIGERWVAVTRSNVERAISYETWVLLSSDFPAAHPLTLERMVAGFIRIRRRREENYPCLKSPSSCGARR